jgi:hypothetical protein
LHPVHGLIEESDAMDLIVRNVRLATMPSSEPVNIGVADGQIIAIQKDF